MQKVTLDGCLDVSKPRFQNGSRRGFSVEVILLFLYLLFLVSTIVIRRLLDTEDVLWVF